VKYTACQGVLSPLTFIPVEKLAICRYFCWIFCLLNYITQFKDLSSTKSGYF